MIRSQSKLQRVLRAHLLALGLVASACAGSAAVPDEDPALQAQLSEQTDEHPADDERADIVVAPSEPLAVEEIPGEVAAKGGAPIELSAGFQSDLDQALQAARQGNRDRAVERLQNLVGDANGGFLAAFNLGVIYEGEADYAQAARRYSQALGKNPDFSPALLNLVRIYLRLGQVQDAAKIAEKYAELRPDNMSHRGVTLEITLHQGKYEEVIQKAKQVLRRDETNVAAMLVMAQANMQLGRHELAEAILQRVRELNPNLSEVYFKYAQIRAGRDEITEAITLYERAIELRPNYPEAHNNLGVLFQQAGDYRAAADQFSAAIAASPDFKQAYLNLGNAQKGLGEFSAAEASFKKALKLDPRYDKALFNLGVLFLDSEVPGSDKIGRLNISLDYFGQYKNVLASAATKDDPADKYIQEARKAIEAEKAREQMMRQAQMQMDEEKKAAADTSDDEEDAAQP